LVATVAPAVVAVSVPVVSPAVVSTTPVVSTVTPWLAFRFNVSFGFLEKNFAREFQLAGFFINTD
jgi:hypothetical protein